jgi:hypothetical protein
MSDTFCARCGLPSVGLLHICTERIEKRAPPTLEMTEGSEICGEVDNSIRGVDGIFRPVFVEQDDGQCLALTFEDAKRLAEFLCEAVDYIEAKNWMKN